MGTRCCWNNLKQKLSKCLIKLTIRWLKRRVFPLLIQNQGVVRGIVGVKPSWFVFFRIVMMISVVLAVVYTAITSFQQLRQEGFDFSAVKYGWWIGAVGVYVGTMFLSCCFWFRVLIALGQKPKFGAALMAFFASQLGKYVPGKAMVVVIRTDMIRGDEVSTAPAAASVFVETLTWIFVGSVIGSLLLVLQFEGQTLLKTIGVLLAIIAGTLTWPPIFRWIALKLGVVKGRKAKKLLRGLNLQTMSFGWLLMTMGWCLNGLSLWMVLKGLPGTAVAISDYSLAMVCVSLATVAGFVSLLPGGLGVRELVHDSATWFSVWCGHGDCSGDCDSGDLVNSGTGYVWYNLRVPAGNW